MKIPLTEYKQILAQRFQNHATAMEQGKYVQPSALSSFYYLFDGSGSGARIMLRIYEYACEERKIYSHDVENELITCEEMEKVLSLCRYYFEKPEKEIKKELLAINKKLYNAQPGWKRVWVHATRRRAVDKYVLLSEYMTTAAVDSFPYWLGLKIAKLYVFDYINYRYCISESSPSRLRRLSSLLAEA